MNLNYIYHPHSGKKLFFNYATNDHRQLRRRITEMKAKNPSLDYYYKKRGNYLYLYVRKWD